MEAGLFDEQKLIYTIEKQIDERKTKKWKKTHRV